MLFVPSSNDFKLQIPTTTGRPAAAYGTIVTPGNNTMGAWAQLIAGASVTDDVFGILININSNAVSAAARDSLVDIGYDPSGGTSYTLIIPYLVATCAAPYNIGTGGVWYYFPLFIPAGSTLAARGSVNNATVGTMRVFANLFCRPRHPESTRVGAYVKAYGAVPASSRGTTVVAGTTAEGAWTLLGATAATEEIWWWQLGIGVNDATMTANAHHCDLGAGNGTNNQILIQDQNITFTAAEQSNNSPLTIGCVTNIASGTNIYGRIQCSGTADTGLSMIAHGLGG